MVRTEEGSILADSPRTKACTSVGRTEASGRAPKAGTRCRRSASSTRPVVFGRHTWAAAQAVAYCSNDTRPARGSTYCPVTTAAVVSSSQRCASTLRAKCLACSRPAASR